MVRSDNETQSPTTMPLLGITHPSGYQPVMPPPPQDFSQTRPHSLRAYSFESISSYSDMEDPNRTNGPQQRPYRSRRRQTSSLEHVKHRRTRSGCYTCRSRRVKCDESQPVCDRCRKGNRDCKYPEPSPSLKQARTVVQSKDLSLDSGSSPSVDEADGDTEEMLPVIEDCNDSPIHTEAQAKYATVEHSLSNEPAEDRVASPSTEFTPALMPLHQRSRADSTSRLTALCAYPEARLSVLPEDVKALLRYHIENLSFYHYAFRSDRGDFFKTTLLEIAINDENEALLYAVVAFAAYHRIFAVADSAITNFLTYYNKSIGLLQQSLKHPNTTTLLTILQLATIEEFLGDWVTLIGHQKACHQLITVLFTPQTVLQNETRRQIIRWYIRYELFSGKMSGGEVSLGREWFEASQQYHIQEVNERPHDHEAKNELRFATNRLLAADFTMLVTARSKGKINEEQFRRDGRLLIDRLVAVGHDLESAYTTFSDSVNSVPAITPSIRRDTDSPHADSLRAEESLVMNFVLLDFWTLELPIRSQVLHQDPVELAPIALKLCKTVDVIQRTDQGRRSAIISCQGAICIASLFLPKDKEHIDWSRRKYAAIEQLGYMYPVALRERMSEIWGLDVRQSWLSGNDSSPAAQRNVREFIEYRGTVPSATLDVQNEHLCGIFRNFITNIRNTNEG